MEHNNQVGSYTVPHKSLMSLLADGVMASLTRPREAEVPVQEEQPADAAVVESFYFRSRSRNKRCGCAQCKAVRAAM